jgi:Peptidase family M23/Secretion system C-terminal sorting domain
MKNTNYSQKCLMFLILVYVIISSSAVTSQNEHPVLIYSEPYSSYHSPCVSDSDLRDVKKQIEQNLFYLRKNDLIPVVKESKTTVLLRWPLKVSGGASDLPFHTVGPYFDLDKNFNKVLDFDCGSKTYDGHNGTDIGLWPFMWKKMDEGSVDIVSAADGIVLAKHDGDYDRSCGASVNIGNYVIVQHTDGSKCHYWHMKQGSVLTKSIGSVVAAGEYLGKVGSSGNSSGPHLHFVLETASGEFIDPFIGKCNIFPVVWDNQKSYIDPTLHLVLTHAAGKGPIFPPCPDPEIPNIRRDFKPGDLVEFSSFFHDQLPGDIVYHKILKPDHSVFIEWTQMMDAALQVSVWISAWFLPVSAQEGKWRYEATYYGKTVSTDFNVSTSTGTFFSNFGKNFEVYPNPVDKDVTIDFGAQLSEVDIVISNVLGQIFQRTSAKNCTKTTLNWEGPGGLYLLTVKSGDQTATKRILKYY